MPRTQRAPFGSIPRLFVTAMALVLALPALSGADKWKMPKEAKPLYYKMQSTTYDRKGRAKKMVYEIDITATEEKDDRGRPIFNVRTTQEHRVPAREIQTSQLAFGALQLGAAVAGMQWLMYQGLLGAVELEVGEKMSYFGGMLAKVTAKETIAGHEGFVVKMFNTSKEQEELVAELVIHPAIPVALRARNYRKGQIKTENLMLEYQAR